jgi:hypothetical protein
MLGPTFSTAETANVMEESGKSRRDETAGRNQSIHGGKEKKQREKNNLVLPTRG